MAMPIQYLPLGARFEPTDEELINHYLRKVLFGEPVAFVIPVADVYGCEPCVHDCDTSMKVFLKNNERYFFVRRKKLSANGNGKCPRRTLKESDDCGGAYWKSNTGDQSILDENNQVIGWKKTLTFFSAKKGQKDRNKCEKMDYIMHEYVAAGAEGFQELALCRIKYNGNSKDGVDAFAGYYPSSKNGKRSHPSLSSGGGETSANYQQDVNEDQEFPTSLGKIRALDGDCVGYFPVAEDAIQWQENDFAASLEWILGSESGSGGGHWDGGNPNELAGLLQTFDATYE